MKKLAAVRNPWMKFYPQDWRGDAKLRACSIAARGLWLELICIMHEADPYGHLLVNGNVVADAQLAMMVGIIPDQLSSLLNELENAGVLSRNGKGFIYSRRMTRDEKKAKDGRKSAKRRWSQDVETKKKKPAPNGDPNSSPIAKKPEARSQSIEKKGSPTDSCTVSEADFDAFWKAFPKGRKNGKKAAQAKFDSVVGEGAISGVGLVTAATRYRDAVGNNFEYVLMPSTWLNQERWNDENPKGTGDKHRSNGTGDSDRRGRIARTYNRRVGAGSGDTVGGAGPGDTGGHGEPEDAQ